MKKNKYKIIFGGKFCRDCGMKNHVFLTGGFDQDTGIPEAEYVCKNKKCVTGYEEYKLVYCKHIYKGGFLNFISPKCIKCGMKEPNSFPYSL